MFEIAQQAETVLKILEEHGYEAYAVGGCVRDLLLGREPGDWDMTTSAHPEDVMRIFAEKAIPTGIQHGTVTVLMDGMPLEVTTYRVDGSYEDHRHPSGVTFTASLKEDLRRRDFTVNAMALDRRGNLVDIFDGQRDLKAGIIRCVGNPRQRFEEDALRILRAVRFASTLGFGIERETDEAVHEMKGLLDTVAAERVRVELLKLLCGQDVLRILMGYADVIGIVVPEILPSVGLDQRNHHHCYNVWEHIAHTVSYIAPEPLLRFTMMMHDLGKPASMTIDEDGVGHFRGHAEISCVLASQVLDRLKFDHESRERILKLVKWHDVPIEPTEKAMRRALNKMGQANVEALLQVKRADNLAQAPAFLGRQKEIDELEQILAKLLEQDACFSLKQLAINGNDLLERGYRGREVGQELHRILEAVIDGTLNNDRPQLLAALKH